MTTAQAMNTAAALLRPKPDGAADPAAEAGWFLERERVRRGMSLKAAHDATGLPVHIIIAIERGRLSRLPAGDEALTMIGTFGHWLGFDPAPLCAHYAGLLQAAPRAVPAGAQLAPPAARRETPAAKSLPKMPFAIRLPRLSNRAIVVGSLSTIAAIFAVTGVMIATGHKPELRQPAPPAAAQPQAPAPQAGLPQPVPPPDDIPTASVDPAPQVDGDGTALQGLGALINETIAAVDASGIGPRAEAMPLRGAQPQPDFKIENGQRVFGSENTDARMVLTAKGQVWLRIEDTTGNVVATVTLNEGDMYRVPNRPDLVAIARDGGLIGVVLDGTDQGTLGQPGEILVGKPLSKLSG